MDLSDYLGYSGVVGKAESGSVKATLYTDFLKTLPTGTYNLTVSFDDGGVGSLPIEIKNPTPTVDRDDNSDSGSSGGGGGGGGASGGSSSATTAAPTLTVDAAKAKAKAAVASAQASGRSKARIAHTGEIKVTPAAWAAFGNIGVDFDFIEGNVVQTRITVNNPSMMTREMLFSGSVKGSVVDRIRAFFEKWFGNRIRVIHLDQTSNFGQPVEIAAKVDLARWDTKKLVFYAYDKASNL